MESQQIRLEPSAIQKIFDILDQEINFSKDLLEILRKEQAALTAMDLQTLVKLSRQKEAQLKKIQQYDAALQETVVRLTKLPEGKIVKISDLRPFIAKSAADRLEQYRDQLEALRQDILDRNHINKHFAKDTLGYLGDAISLITGAIREQSIYSARGGPKAYANSPTMISREV
ncbi:MAG: hypothetical protein A2511_02440 [Deltaproteobacteria bacterium RIFOXYD12_FULL_50_9]|nr:MAG: hypothetical protein A2511_02440 [Deltaproteobacteria bacterium RIFOXYD12_FULL_50_9]